MVLKTKPHKEVPSAELEKHLDKTATKGAIAEVYEIYKIHDKRYVGGKAEYKCSWKGYNKNHKTWEPAQNLHEYGAGETLVEYEIAHSGGTIRSNRYVNACKDERAVKYLMGKHGLCYTKPVTKPVIKFRTRPFGLFL